MSANITHVHVPYIMGTHHEAHLSKNATVYVEKRLTLNLPFGRRRFTTVKKYYDYKSDL